MIKVLIVDDEYIMRQGLKYMLNWEQEGFEIIGEATNGLEAFSIIQKNQPHIVICDIVMPMMDGVDFSMMLHKTYPSIQIIILSGYDNFEYVKQTLMNGVMDYVLKPTLNQEELRKILYKAAQRIPGYRIQKNPMAISCEHMLERYILGHDKELDVKQIDTCFSGSEFYLFAVKIKKVNKEGQDLSSILFQKIEREMREDREFQKRVLLLREELVCIIFSISMFQKKKLFAFLEQICQKLSVLCNHLLGICSSSFTQIEEINSVYRNEILPNGDQAFYYENEKILFMENRKNISSSGVNMKLDFFQYNYYLEKCQFQNAVRVLQQYNEAALQAYMDSYKLKNQMKNMIYHFLDTLQTEDRDKEECRYVIFGQIDQSMYETAYRESMEQIWKTLLCFSGKQRPVTDERILKILEYISENYQEDLTLEILSERFNFNYHYLSTYFSQQMKEGFSEYLNRIRISRACDLLKNTGLSIAKISEEVGYSEHSYFSRVFKKITGKTPSLWRRGQKYEE
ncbi:MAG: response regulator [Blautia sp.]